ncbi:MAG TPA: sulfurtransferase TusA family protein [Gammaproteobacteria bacterium]|nr:sulfurtransferase TusA family protein [Gammaproteobacteria bacterium]
MKFDTECDTSGLKCPQVLLKAKQVFSHMKKGEILKIISTDPSSVLDVKVFAATKSHELIKQLKKDNSFIFWIKK